MHKLAAGILLLLGWNRTLKALEDRSPSGPFSDAALKKELQSKTDQLTQLQSELTELSKTVRDLSAQVAANARPVVEPTLTPFNALVGTLMLLCVIGGPVLLSAGQIREAIAYAAYAFPILAAVTAGLGLYAGAEALRWKSVKWVLKDDTLYVLSVVLLTLGLASHLISIGATALIISNLLGCIGLLGTGSIVFAKSGILGQSGTTPSLVAVLLGTMSALAVLIAIGWIYLLLNGDTLWAVDGLREMIRHVCDFIQR